MRRVRPVRGFLSYDLKEIPGGGKVALAGFLLALVAVGMSYAWFGVALAIRVWR